MGQANSCLFGCHVVDDGVTKVKYIKIISTHHKPPTTKKKCYQNSVNKPINANDLNKDDEDPSQLTWHQKRSTTVLGTSNNYNVTKVENNRVGLNISSDISIDSSADPSNPNQVAMRTVSSAVLGQKHKRSIKLVKLKRTSIGSKQSSKRLFCLNLDDKFHILFFMDSEIKGSTKLERRWKLGRDSSWKEEIRVPEKDKYFKPQEQKSMLITKDTEEIRRVLSERVMKGKCKKEDIIDSPLVTGTQIFVTRLNIENAPPKPYDYMAGQDCLREKSFTRYHCVLSSNGIESKMIEKTPVQWHGSHKTSLSSIEVARDLMNAVAKFHSLKVNDGQERSLLHYDLSCEHRVYPLVHDVSDKMRESGIVENIRSKVANPILFAMIPIRISRSIYSDSAILCNDIEPAEEIICVDQSNRIYVCDLGLTSDQCHFITEVSERCARGTYDSYTYAKQTLGCRDYDELSVICEWPVKKAYSSICHYLENKTTDHFATRKRPLVLDDREPHIVKYDTSRQERQKLDMHTDKSEWTFLIALSDCSGVDYEGGGTYFECIDSTVHLQKGQAIIFPGKLRHRGQKIVSGTRFLLVGFLVEQKDSSKKLSVNDMLRKRDVPET